MENMPLFNESVNLKIICLLIYPGADPGFVKRGGKIQKGGPGGWYNLKIAQTYPKIGWICMIYLSKGGTVPIRTIHGSAPEYTHSQ